MYNSYNIIQFFRFLYYFIIMIYYYVTFKLKYHPSRTRIELEYYYYIKYTLCRE